MKKILLIISLICMSQVSFAQVFGNAIGMDGVDDFGIVSHHESLNPNDGSWSMTCWLKAANKDQVAPILMKRLPSSPYTQYSFGFGKDDPHEPQEGKRIRVNYIEIAGGSERSGHTTNEVIDGAWHHFAVIADKSQNGIFIYMDGALLDFVPLYYFGGWPNLQTTNDLHIAIGGAGDLLEGPLDELSIWKKALSQAEIQKFMNQPLDPEYYQSADSGLVAYYQFEVFEDLGIGAGGSNDIRDMSLYGNHMETNGNPVLVPSVSVATIKDELIGNIDFKVFPNPCSDKFVLEYRSSSNKYPVTDIINLAGSVVKSIILNNNPGLNNTEVDISDLPAGIYFIRIQSDQGIGVNKLIVR